MEENFLSPFIVEGRICSVSFGTSTFDEIYKSSISDCPISHPAQLRNPFLGLPLQSGRCESCGTSEHGHCEGHFGYIQLPVPIYDPRHIGELRRVLNLLCLKCLRLKKGKVLSNQDRKSSYLCVSCPDVQLISVKEAKSRNGALYLELKVASRSTARDDYWRFLERYGYNHGGGATCRSLLPFEALKILDSIPDETKKRLAARGCYPQNGFIMVCLPVPPNCLSVPDVSNGTAIMASDLSNSLLKKVLNVIETIKKSRSGPPSFQAHEIEANDLQAVVAQYIQLRGTTKAPGDFRRRFLVGKEEDASCSKAWLERMKTLFIRKGSGFSSRSVITGDSYRGVNEIGIPLEIAQKITFEERVTAHNISELQDLMDKQFCVTYRDGMSTYAVRVGSRNHASLRIGQIVNRRIMDGDVVFINRPPTTHKHSLQAFSVYVHEDHTVKINPLICAPLAADFDGDCVHLFYPQSLAAKAEVLELFSVEEQLLSSHTGNLNLQLVHDSLLSLKLFLQKIRVSKTTAQQLAMFISPLLPSPAMPKILQCGPLWTALQILQAVLPADFCCSAESHLICQSELLRFNFNRDLLQSALTEIVTSVFKEKGPKETLKLFNILQPLLMEILFYNGYSISLKDFHVPNNVLKDVKEKFRDIILQLKFTGVKNDGLVELHVENCLKNVKVPVVSFLLNSSPLGNLIDSKSNSAVSKVVEQIGFLGLQLYTKGKFYSKDLLDDINVFFQRKLLYDGNDCPPEALGLIRSAFFEGLSPSEELVHSLASRETLIRSSRGLTEPGTLFKNLMAILRDVVLCYDGTVRNICTNSLVQFEYGVTSASNLIGSVPAGEPVGVLAATAISNPSYKAVLDSSQSNNSSWALMKDILLCKVNFKKESLNDRRVILFLNDCECGKKYCKDIAACRVQNQLRRITLKHFATELFIECQKLQNSEASEPSSGLVGHIHLDKMKLMELSFRVDEICQKCEKAIEHRGTKKSNLSQVFKGIHLCASESCTLQKQYEGMWSPLPCLQFYWGGSGTSCGSDIEETSELIANVICPVLLGTVLKGDPRLDQANIIWVDPNSSSWVGKTGKIPKREIAVEVVVDEDSVKQHGDAWRFVLDSCLPVIDLIDTNRSIPYGVKQIQELIGISCAFEQAVQRLSASINSVSKGVLKEHLMLVASVMTCTGNLIGFNPGGCRALFRSLNVQAPITEATIFAPMKSFEKAAEKFHADSLSSVVATCAWGKTVSVGTGMPFELIWSQKEAKEMEDGKTDAYGLLHLLSSSSVREDSTQCIGEEVDDFHGEDLPVSPEQNMEFEDPAFEGKDFTETGNNSGWDPVSAPSVKSDEWGGWSSTKDVDTSRNNLKSWSGWEVIEKDPSAKNIKDIDCFKAREGKKSSDTGSKWNVESQKKPVFSRQPDGWAAWKSSGVQEMGKVNSEPVPQGHSNSERGWQSQSSRDEWGQGAQQNQAASLGKCSGWGDATGTCSELQTNNEVEAPSEPVTPLDQSNPRGGWKSNDTERRSGAGKKWPQADQVGRPEESANVVGSWESTKASKEPRAQSNSWGSWKPDKGPRSPSEKATNDWNSRSVESEKVEEWKDWQKSDSFYESPKGSNSWVTYLNENPSDKMGSSPSLDGWVLNDSQTTASPASSDWNKRHQGWESQASKSVAWDGPSGGERRSRNPSVKPFVKFGDQVGHGPNGVLTATGRRMDQFTTEEDEILKEIDPVIMTIKNILRMSSNGGRLSDDDQQYILDNVFHYHPHKSSKMGEEFSYIMVDEAAGHQGSRCFYLVFANGAREDFSYYKCMQNFVQVKYPERAELFNGKYFRRPGGPSNRQHL